MSKLSGFHVAVVATDGFEESELTEPVAALRDAGARVTILSLKPGQIQGVRHDLDKTVRVKVDCAIGDVSADEFDAVHLPGGAVNADSLRTAPRVQAFLLAMQAAGKPFAVICHAPWEHDRAEKELIVRLSVAHPREDHRQPRGAGQTLV